VSDVNFEFRQQIETFDDVSMQQAKAIVVCTKYAQHAEELQMFVQMLDLVDH
jgi:methylmalonyl-CoA mutase cobalamin-binding subunit